MEVNDEVLLVLLISTVGYLEASPGIHILSCDDTVLAGSWNDLQEFLFQQVMTFASMQLPVANFTFEVM